jgi:hypothetical protein
LLEEAVSQLEYERPEVVTYTEEEILQDLVVNCGEFSF